VAVLEKAGATYERFAVPGAFEIPVAISFGIASGRFDGYVALGCVIRGETSHYDHICDESARGLGELGLRHNAAIGYGILTVENEEQAWVRARVSDGNKGGDTARACLAMIGLKRQLGLRSL
jgi:6,7-dimethyl-8-ribityllumazine synthase